MKASTTVKGDILDEGIVFWVAVKCKEYEVTEGWEFMVGVEEIEVMSDG